MNLSQVPPGVSSLLFTVNIFDDKGSFQEITDIYVRLFTASGEVLAIYYLDGAIKSRAMIFCALHRSGGSWSLQALGKPCDGKAANSPETLQACVDLVRQAGK